MSKLSFSAVIGSSSMSYYGADYPRDVLEWMRTKELSSPEVDPESPQVSDRLV